jgi:hypothetical protein
MRLLQQLVADGRATDVTLGEKIHRCPARDHAVRIHPVNAASRFK